MWSIFADKSWINLKWRYVSYNCKSELVNTEYELRWSTYFLIKHWVWGTNSLIKQSYSLQATLCSQWSLSWAYTFYLHDWVLYCYDYVRHAWLLALNVQAILKYMIDWLIFYSVTKTDDAGLDDDKRLQETERRGPTTRGVATSDIWTCPRGREPQEEEELCNSSLAHGSSPTQKGSGVSIA